MVIQENKSTTTSLADRPWLLGRVPAGFWDHLENRVSYLRWLGQQIGFRCPEDWYQVRQRHFKANCGCGLLANVYRFSVLEAARELYPEYNWLPWRFGGVPQRFWQSKANRHAYMKWLGEQLGFQNQADWYRVRKVDFYRHSGGGLLANYFHDSPQKALQDYLPEADWKPWLFRSVPQNFWQQPGNRQAYLNWLGEELGFEKTADWYQLRTRDLSDNGGGSLLTCYYAGSLQRALYDFRPDYRWEPERFMVLHKA